MKTFTVKKSNHSGGHHWIAERVTSIANIFFVAWFMISMIMIATDHIDNARVWLSTPFNAITMILMLVNMFYHGAMGIQVVVEDYIHNKIVKIPLLLANNFACIAAAATGIFAVFHIYASVNFN